MRKQKFQIIALLSLFLLAASAYAQTAEIPPMSGGVFTMTQSTVAGGGGETQQNAQKQQAVIGQPLAGLHSSGNQFKHYTGFLLPDSFGRISTAVAGGQVLGEEGKGIRNVQVTITFPNGETRTVFSGERGYYRFADIPVGEAYTISVSAKRFSFSQAAKSRKILSEVQDINFIGSVQK